jgi:hypothetical protein
MTDLTSLRPAAKSFTSTSHRTRRTTRSLSLLAAIAAVSVVALGAGCSGADPAPAAGADSGTVGDTDTTSDTAWSHGDSGAPIDSGAHDTAPVDTAPPCTPTAGADLPDDSFADSNCDGIDGDKSKAIFVAPTGSDAASGAFNDPVKTINKAIELASAVAKDVYVCNGTYAENVRLATATSIYGGYDCANGWKRIADRARIAPSTGVPLTIASVTGATASGGSTVIDRIALKAADATDPASSSIASIVSGSTDVTIKNGLIEAGNGADGVAPSPPPTDAPAQAGADGDSLRRTTCVVGSTSNLPDCNTLAYGQHTHTTVPACQGHGGAGGNGGTWNTAGTGKVSRPGQSGLPTGLGGSSTLDVGTDGGPGSAGTAGAPSTSGFGGVSASGYSATNAGADGTAGGSAGGGAGGHGGAGVNNSPHDTGTQTFTAGGGGGEGGYGGCGGAGGKGAGGGGASIGILSFNSMLAVAKTTITTKSGGRGGGAGAGGAGQPGGAAGKGGTGTDAVSDGSLGGAGGTGGNGGPSGAGGGGPSICIVAKGTAPTTTGVTFYRGVGGKGGKGIGSMDGADGESTVDIKTQP